MEKVYGGVGDIYPFRNPVLFFFVFLGSYRIVLDIWQFDMKKKKKKKKFELEKRNPLGSNLIPYFRVCM